MQPAERARLIKLGEWSVLPQLITTVYHADTDHSALNHLEKHRLRLKDAGQNGDIKKIWLAACAMHNDAEHLLVLGKILGDDGWHFTHTGASVAQILLVNHNLRPEPGMNDMAIQLWKDRQNMSTASANQANLADRLRQTPCARDAALCQTAYGVGSGPVASARI
ncbi:unnamed protein product [Zymoseptoria tritici ST99CH_3D1]|nr:unnamed protein product [Zymoseptoria tritici ST99CH_3D1]